MGDIETNLRHCPGVRDAVVLRKEFAPNDNRLVAYIVTIEPATAQFAETVKAFAKARLPEYMVPAAFLLLDQLPLNPNGKVDREALLHIEAAPENAKSGPDSPRGELERQVAAIFASSLMLDDVGLDDDFFDLGGDSLKAVLVVANVTSQLGFTVPIEALFETRTLRNFCQFLECAPH